MKGRSIEFEITIDDVAGPDQVEVQGVLTSPVLDPQMHPKGRVALYISTKRNAHDGTSGFILDAFQLRSLQEYLEQQSHIRDVLESELPKEQEASDPDGDPVRGDVWSWARVQQLQLRLRDERVPEAVKRLREAGLSDEQIEQSMTEPESPQTQTFFTVNLDCDWAEYYSLDARFRDGRFLSLDRF